MHPPKKPPVQDLLEWQEAQACLGSRKIRESMKHLGRGGNVKKPSSENPIESLEPAGKAEGK